MNLNKIFYGGGENSKYLSVKNGMCYGASLLLHRELNQRFKIDSLSERRINREIALKA